MTSSLWRNINYKTPIKYYINTYIREYDLSKMTYKDLTYSGISFVYAFAKEDFTFNLDLFLDTHSKDGYTCEDIKK